MVKQKAKPKQLPLTLEQSSIAESKIISLCEDWINNGGIVTSTPFVGLEKTNLCWKIKGNYAGIWSLVLNNKFIGQYDSFFQVISELRVNSQWLWGFDNRIMGLRYKVLGKNLQDLNENNDYCLGMDSATTVLGKRLVGQMGGWVEPFYKRF